MIRSGDIVEHIIKIYPDDEGLLPYLKTYNEDEYIEIKKRLAIVRGSSGELLEGYCGANNEIRGGYSLQYFDDGNTLSWVDVSDLRFVCTAKDYIIRQLNEIK